MYLKQAVIEPECNSNCRGWAWGKGSCMKFSPGYEWALDGGVLKGGNTVPNIYKVVKGVDLMLNVPTIIRKNFPSTGGFILRQKHQFYEEEVRRRGVTEEGWSEGCICPLLPAILHHWNNLASCFLSSTRAGRCTPLCFPNLSHSGQEEDREPELFYYTKENSFMTLVLHTDRSETGGATCRK